MGRGRGRGLVEGEFGDIVCVVCVVGEVMVCGGAKEAWVGQLTEGGARRPSLEVLRKEILEKSIFSAVEGAKWPLQ